MNTADSGEYNLLESNRTKPNMHKTNPPFPEAVVPFPPPRTAHIKQQAAFAAGMGIPETWADVSQGTHMLRRDAPTRVPACSVQTA